MFQKKEMNEIDRQYFEVKETKAYHIILKSKNCGHIWDIQSKETTWGKRSLVIYHKHKEADPFHEQAMMHPRTVTEAQELIKKHDKWHLEGRK